MSTPKKSGRPQFIWATVAFIAMASFLGLRMAGAIADPLAVPMIGLGIAATAALTVWGGFLSARRRGSGSKPITVKQGQS